MEETSLAHSTSPRHSTKQPNETATAPARAGSLISCHPGHRITAVGLGRIPPPSALVPKKERLEVALTSSEYTACNSHMEAEHNEGSPHLNSLHNNLRWWMSRLAQR